MFETIISSGRTINDDYQFQTQAINWWIFIFPRPTAASFYDTLHITSFGKGDSCLSNEEWRHFQRENYSDMRKYTDSSHPEPLVQSNPFVTWHKALLDKGIQSFFKWNFTQTWHKTTWAPCPLKATFNQWICLFVALIKFVYC